ncbi:hypothetical protein QA601_12030 [Chitinispirillales bacterium ANBcel5]|uniref:hypothetical protein n=1 Tax=Cellulosispirillum alkaliphilum TaxID=3039283 RepID=UPI002A54DACD|nr:hypothetical protein [Chitinispirillales bacterium ANBcel5]
MSAAGSAVCLISRQPLYPNKKTAWVSTAQKAVSFLKDGGYTLITSTGMQTWELLTALGRQYSLPMKVLVPESDKKSFTDKSMQIRFQFDLSEQLTEFIPVSQTIKATEFLKLRDRFAVESADLLLPLSIRPEGSFEKLLLNTDKKKVDWRFFTGYPKNERKGLKSYHLQELPESFRGRYFIHWTRSFKSAWPTEKLIDYYNDIINNEHYPRCAFETLKNIILSGKIVSSKRHMPKPFSCVSFTSSSPSQFSSLMRWRKRYREMSFEPYGIGVERTFGEKLGICAVKYQTYGKELHKNERWKYLNSSIKGDWKREQEYRFCGDFLLKGIPEHKLACFCPTEKECRELEERFGLKTFPLS